MHECEHCGCSDALSVQVLTLLLEIKLRLEQHMTQEADALNALSAKVDLLIADVRAALAVDPRQTQAPSAPRARLRWTR
jgi:hypothetical protein